MAKKQLPRTLIKEWAVNFKEVMQDGLLPIADLMIGQITKAWKNATPAQRAKAVGDIPIKGKAEYKQLIKDAITLAAYEALQDARKEVPKASNVKLVEKLDSVKFATKTIYEKLPKALRDFIDTNTELLVGTQLDDLKKNLLFQYRDSFDTTEDLAVLRGDLKDAAVEFIDGQGVTAGANLVASKTVNEARSAFFFDKETLEEIDAFEFVNGDPVTPVCADLAGTIFAKDDPNMFRYTPPLHWNCKSYIQPILKGNLGNKEIEKLKPSTKKIEDTIQFSCCSH